MQNKGENMMEKFMKKYSLDIAYFSLAIILILMIIESCEVIDIGYLCIMTFYYIRIKIHRWHTKYLI